jgi:hypothetical protein
MPGYVNLVDGTVYEQVVECFRSNPGSVDAASSKVRQQ